jgi:hypothetical protein
MQATGTIYLDNVDEVFAGPSEDGKYFDVR